MKTPEPVIAFDIHPTRIGYAVVSKSGPIDWGVTRLRQPALQTSKHLNRLVDELCRLWLPAVGIIRKSRRDRQHRSKVISRALASRGIPVRWVPDRPVCRPGKGPTKNELAGDLARQYPELKHLLPRKRRLWEPEDDRMHIFTAVGLAILFSPRTGKIEVQIGQVAE